MEKKNLAFEENHVLYYSDLRFPDEIDLKVKAIEESKKLLIIAATDGLDPNNVISVLDSLKELTFLQEDLKALKARIEALN